MNTELSNQKRDQPFEALVSSNSGNFNFELWAREVRRQMVASLHKRAAKGKRKEIERYAKKSVSRLQSDN
jgi:hypothetical protein